MSRLFLSNERRMVKIKIDDIQLQYLGPKNLVEFKKVNNVINGCIYVDTVFVDEGREYIEEDYIDVKDLLIEYNYNADVILRKIDSYEIVKEEKMSKYELIDRAIMVSDNFALIANRGSADDIQILAVNMTKTNSRALLRLENYYVLSSNMNDAMLKRAVRAVKRNTSLLIESLEEMELHA